MDEQIHLENNDHSKVKKKTGNESPGNGASLLYLASFVLGKAVVSSHFSDVFVRCVVPRSFEKKRHLAVVMRC